VVHSQAVRALALEIVRTLQVLDLPKYVKTAILPLSSRNMPNEKE
jgi:hypothetical protein